MGSHSVWLSQTPCRQAALLPNPKQPQSQTTPITNNPIPNNPNPKQPKSKTSMSSVLDWAGLGHWASVVTFLGLISAARIGFGLLKNLHDLLKAYVLPRIWPVDLVKTYGKWAVVTGCTGGIGKAYVLAMAARGMDIVLVGRSMEKLKALEAEVKRRHNCRVLIIQADFTDVTVLPVIVSRLKDERVEVGILVNNVGILGPGNLPFLELDLAIVKDMPTVNITAATYLCHQLLPAMVAKGKGAVINIASIGSYFPGPYLAEYIATKHYMHSFTESLALELEGTGVLIQEIDPGVVNTEMTKEFDPGQKGISPNPEEYLASALPTIGWVQRTCGHWSHGLFLVIMDFLIGWDSWLMKRLGRSGQKKVYEESIQRKLKVTKEN